MCPWPLWPLGVSSAGGRGAKETTTEGLFLFVCLSVCVYGHQQRQVTSSIALYIVVVDDVIVTIVIVILVTVFSLT